MAIMVQSVSMPTHRRSPLFHTDASEVMNALRTRVAEVLAELGDFSRPADVQRALDLDKTLGRQVFKLACTSDALGSGNVIPSRTSMRRFLDAAKERGITVASVDNVWSAYKVFENLIETHAGNRATFNSMVSAASGIDDEWLAADAQHRRNSFRGMSHSLGIQAKTHHQLSIVNENDDGSQFDIAMISGHYGLRVLRQLPRVRAFGYSLSAADDTASVYREPLGLSDLAEGHLLAAYCSQPLPEISVADGCNQYGQWREISIVNPPVGKIGTSNLVFGTVYRKLPALNQPLNISMTSNKPVELMLFDVLKKRTKADVTEPNGKASMGHNEKFGAEIYPLIGKFKPEFLGKGPAALATPELPRYRDMLSAVAGKLDWDIDDYDAWRMRVEFPIHQSTATMTWEILMHRRGSRACEIDDLLVPLVS